MTWDAIVVGSGPAGVHGAAALVERGRRVLMLDGGDRGDSDASLAPPGSFTEARKTDARQFRYMLGQRFEGVPVGSVGLGAQLTPPRQYVTARAARLLPVHSDSFITAESLALGGLGAAWGAGVFAFDASELAEWPIPPGALRAHSDAVARRIGIAADHDDLARFMDTPPSCLPPLEVDTNAEQLLRAYRRQRASLNRRGFFMGRPPLAVCTVRFRGRGPHRYGDMDFWSDADRAVYRPRYTVDELEKEPRFRYAAGRLVLRFDETDSGVTVITRHLDTGAVERFEGRALLLGAGTLGTARIVLRSLGRYGQRVPLLCNPYTYVPTLNVRMLGREPREARHSLAQLSAIVTDTPGFARGAVQVQFYSYRSLLTFRLLAEAPLPFREGIRVMRELVPMLGILGINHDDSRTTGKYLALERSGAGEDVLHVNYALSEAEKLRIERGERRVLRFFRSLGAWPLKRVHPGHGSSIHYAGTFPMSARPEALGCDADGRLAASRAVYLVDGSGFPYLPAKGLTFTIMANANRIASALAGRL